MSLLFKSGGFQDTTCDNRRSSWYPSFPRRARKIAHKGIFFARRGNFFARRGNFNLRKTGGGLVEDWWRFRGDLHLHKLVTIRIIQIIYTLMVEDGNKKRKK